ncbi:hypothetical protein [Sphingopyxis sp.]|uniref:hypothetical protein n=1 Tax=Sphingopyxis sp. TaxID=1908224 RepID=UPI001D1EDB5B|nr:hypothetical protein [Sphingopyxis sp.]MBW8296715.1 hypothetical protein [Sphingopyxis sp.]
MTAVRAILAVAACFCPSLVSGQQVSPMVLELPSSDPAESRTIIYRNTATSPVAVETVVTLRSYDEHGVATDVPAADHLIVFPEAFWASPSDSQNVSVRYTGPRPLDMSKMYVIGFREVPLNVNPVTPASGVTIRLEFRAITHVTPDRATADIEVGERSAATDGTVSIELINRGNKFARIDEGSLAFGDGIGATTIPGQALLSDSAPAWILPNSRRVLTLPAAQHPLVAEDAARPRWITDTARQ